MAKRFFLILTIFVSIIFWQQLWQKRNIKSVPNPDIFQYINDGNNYLKFKLPVSIHPPPLAPILITSVAKVIRPFTTYPEIASAHLINITSASIVIINIFILTSNFLNPVSAFLLSILVATNQIFILYSLDVTSEIVYCLFLTLSLITYYHSKKPFSYIFFGLLFLLRYESIVIPISIFIIEYFSTKKLLKTKNPIYTFIPITLWLIILNFHNYGNSIIDNAYLNEIWNNLHNIPNSLPFTSLIEIFTFELSTGSNIELLFGFAILAIGFYQVTKTKMKPIAKAVYLIFSLHLLFLFMFPNFYPRYYIPVIWIAYLIIINQKSLLISSTIFICLLSYNLLRVSSPSIYSNPNEMKEYRLTADWINNTQFDKQTVVLTFEPHILKYFITNPKVIVKDDVETPFTQCQAKLPCISATLLSNNPNVDFTYDNTPNLLTEFNSSTIPNIKSDIDVIIIVTSYSSNSLFSANDKFTSKLHFIDAFNEKNIENNTAEFTYLTTIGEEPNKANIYKYIPR